MFRSIIRFCSWVALLVMASFTVAQTEFSADIVDTQKEQRKVYFGKDKVRVEPAKKGPRGGLAWIFDLSTQTGTMLMEVQHMYTQLPRQAADQGNPYQFPRTWDVDDACSDCLQQFWNWGGTCHKVGSDTVNDRATVKYEGTNAKGQSETVWLDVRLHFPVKWQRKNGGGELQNIKEGDQPASLFEIPTGYTKFDPESTMQKQNQ